jgi:hypothetical protein
MPPKTCEFNESKIVAGTCGCDLSKNTMPPGVIPTVSDMFASVVLPRAETIVLAEKPAGIHAVH